MSEFTRDLVDQMALELGGQATWKENPLQVFGISQTILGLGLDNTTLHSLCRDIAKKVSAKLHTDRNVEITPELRQRLSVAFELIKNREHFDKALDQLRHQRSVVVSEVNQEKELNRGLRQELSRTSEQMASLRAKLKEKATHASHWQTKLAHFSRLSVENIARPTLPDIFRNTNTAYEIDAVQELLVVHAEIVFAENIPFSKRSFTSLRAHYEKLSEAERKPQSLESVLIEAFQEVQLTEKQIQKKRALQKELAEAEWDMLRRAFYETGMGMKIPKEVFAQVDAAHDPFPVIELDEFSFFYEQGLDRLCGDARSYYAQFGEVFVPHARQCGVAKPTLSAQYKVILATLEKFVSQADKRLFRVRIQPECMRVEYGVIKNGKNRGKRIVGSMPLERISDKDIEMHTLSFMPAISLDALFTSIEPFVMPYASLLLANNAASHVVSFKEPRARRNDYYYHTDVVCPVYFVLDVMKPAT